MIEPIRILVLCTGNRCRSQMAQGWLQHFAHEVEVNAVVCSAGTQPKGVHPLAVRVMAEAGIDVSSHQSQHVDEYADQQFSDVITVCDRAKEACPIFPGAGTGQATHHPFEDPDIPGLPDQQLIPIFRRVRDEIRDWAKGFIQGRVKTSCGCSSGTCE